MFIKLQNRIINTDKVWDFELRGDMIYAHFAEGRWIPFYYDSEEEAAAAHEDILHMIDNNYIPSWVQNTPMSYNPHDYDTSNGTGNWHGDIPF